VDKAGGHIADQPPPSSDKLASGCKCKCDIYI